jgi:hypothetical protein
MACRGLDLEGQTVVVVGGTSGIEARQSPWDWHAWGLMSSQLVAGLTKLGQLLLKSKPSAAAVCPSPSMSMTGPHWNICSLKRGQCEKSDLETDWASINRTTAFGCQAIPKFSVGLQFL